MSRSQQGQVFNTANDESTANEASAQKSEQAEQSDIGNQQSKLAQFSAQNPYMQGGAFQTAQNQISANNADANSAATKAVLQQTATRTGQNPNAANATASSLAQANERQQAGQEAGATTSRLGSEAGYNETALNAGNQIIGEQNALANTQAGQAQGELGTQETAAQTPSFLDELGAGLAGGSGQLGSAAITTFCPAAGSLYLMADGTEKRVEQLAVGDKIVGIDGEYQVVEEIQSAPSPIIQTVTENGFIGRTSPTHAFALPLGGFVGAMKSMGKTIVTAKGRSLVVSVELDGVEIVYNVITDGSHTYRADGLWALGVGDAERRIDMEAWREIGERMLAGAR